jgi:hypothetical protein
MSFYRIVPPPSLAWLAIGFAVKIAWAGAVLCRSVVSCWAWRVVILPTMCILLILVVLFATQEAHHVARWFSEGWAYVSHIYLGFFCPGQGLIL